LATHAAQLQQTFTFTLARQKSFKDAVVWVRHAVKKGALTPAC
jgi:hypothetical protein